MYCYERLVVTDNKQRSLLDAGSQVEGQPAYGSAVKDPSGALGSHD